MEKNVQTAFQTALVEAIPSVWRFALALSGTPDHADDLTQSTSLRALERSHQLQDISGVKPWALTICRSIWYNEVRARAVRKAQSLDVRQHDGIAAEISPPETNIFLREVLDKVMDLPEAQRVVVVLVLVEGHSYKEAAAILDVPIGTIMSRLSSARKSLSVLAESMGDGARREAAR